MENKTYEVIALVKGFRSFGAEVKESIKIETSYYGNAMELAKEKLDRMGWIVLRIEKVIVDGTVIDCGSW